MIITDSMKSGNNTQLGSMEAVGNLGANTSSINTGTTVTSNSTATGTPLRARNRERNQEDRAEKQENVVGKGKNPPKPPEEFYKDLQLFHEKRGYVIISFRIALVRH